MKSSLRNTALAAAFATCLWPAVRANAACTNLADLTGASGADCKQDNLCLNEILKDTTTFVNAVQKNYTALVSGSIGGKNTSAQLYTCAGGVSNAQPCLGNNGGCKSGANKGAACNADADCGVGFVVGSCAHNKGFGCNSTLATSVDGTLDQFECQPSQAKSAFSKANIVAANNLAKNIGKKCFSPAVSVDVDPTEIGINNIPACATGLCSGGTNAGAKCNSTTEATICTGGGVCDFSDHQKVYQQLEDCVKSSADGDLQGGKIVDTIFRPLQKVTGTGSLPPKSKPGPADLFPRQVLQMTGGNVLQIGSGVPGNNGTNPAPGGTVTTLSLAQCVGGNGKPACLNNADCGTGGTCTRNTAGGGLNTLNGAQNVHKCCSTSAAANIGGSCSTDTDCGGTGGACGINSNCLGNILTITDTASNGVIACLVTHTKNAGNGTTTTGSINLTTGDYSITSPISTDVFIGSACPKCIAANALDGKSNGCGGGANDQGLCNSPDGSTDQACLPSGSAGAKVPNPFTLSSGTESISPATTKAGTCGFCEDTGSPINGACDTPPCNSCGTSVTPAVCGAGKQCDTISGITAQVFCGFCDSVNNQNGLCDHGGAGDAVCAIGCQSNAECTTKTGGAGNFCDFGSSAPGFHGDCSTQQLASVGEVNQYAPTAVGLFCTGKTGATLGPLSIDALNGLPGPVRVTQPYALGYVFSKDH